MSNVRKGLVNPIAREAFVRELEALTRKHRISIGGCGCYGYPLLEEYADVTDERSGYSLSNDELKWVTPRDEYDWDNYSAGIIK